MRNCTGMTGLVDGRKIEIVQATDRMPAARRIPQIQICGYHEIHLEVMGRGLMVKSERKGGETEKAEIEMMETRSLAQAGQEKELNMNISVSRYLESFQQRLKQGSQSPIIRKTS